METNQDKINARVMISSGQGRRFVEPGWDRTDWIGAIGAAVLTIGFIAWIILFATFVVDKA